VVLHRGTVSVRTLADGRGPEPVIAVAGLVIRPSGTAFRVRLPADGQPEVAVADGEVQVRSAGASVQVRAGSVLAWGGGQRRLQPAARQRLAEELSRAVQLARSAARQTTAGRLSVVGPKRQQIRVDGVLLGSSWAVSLVGTGIHEVALVHGERVVSRRQVRVAAGSTSRLRLVPQGPQRQPRDGASKRGAGRTGAQTIRGALRQIESLLARGQTRLARQQALHLLRASGARAHRPQLLTLVAESHVREGRYREARRTYLRIWQRHPATNLGAEALYMTGSLELEQLGDLGAAREHLRRYLASYRRGHQREGAYFLLFRTLQRAGEGRAAGALARRYLAEFPGGQFARAMGGGAGPSKPRSP
jgi:tetratricopeptide (TPR) repeat protein